MVFWQRLKQDKLAMLCLGIVGGVFLLGVLAPVIAPHDPLAPNLAVKYAGVSPDYPFGADQLGRCVLSRLLYGIRTTVGLSLVTMAATLLIGTLLGLTAGFFRGRIDEGIMRLCDVLLSFPSEVMILAIVGMLGPGLTNVVIANIAAKWAWYTRMIRSLVIQYTDRNYLRFAKVAGCSTGHIMRKHLLPGVLSDIVVLATLDTGWVILSISALSFLGLGVQAPMPEWGMMLNEAKNVMITHPQQMLAPGLAILLVVSAFSFLGDSIRDALDPKYNRHKAVNK
ncbi:ABC transporter permease subunit|uniref:Nickel transport system permease protein n=1 Tax=Dendrosporobacter quercicolus TaxID=146817 RepID=A0A1G9QVN5_9FIRM|nr:nickel/cobalt ABC transporter permease [Dendrosporobacter quercicolus]NSL48384.1 ABC transporter permease subunit [Dendrosporobacter quercicolus DSM 1736]SDM15092.1 nickel transport system permease protein [Dendrosporobacter quercicolus]